ncbi:Type II secretory pathway, ATPase PulE/Tfp pilus assembly pathway, ATPase PilB [Enhygromyxa salina]|uniref:Type II secretory pathway, ATPase PulE/Tfp pilus assembly pathway, ATPase PilB n=1 Tax=Enhygromyxa salina TaxID=215803 RepID=A0A0C2D1H9_9BACT|nr:hypothetical protein [Enhygromyxa salina]KIG15665.1 Type II secretory pathway, ATPase PulE/Tfp pilus assembly pathway, ATPase PilB [Enhygromyxa salina]
MYVELFADATLSAVDPVERIATSIEFAALETAQLFSGHRGTGKSTQLRRLKCRLERDPAFKVVICDMEDYLPMTDEVDVVDFLLAAAGALSEALSVPELLGDDPVHSYWARFTGWLRSQKIEVTELGLAASATGEVVGTDTGLGVKLNLKTDPDFRKRVRERMKLHVGAFRVEVHSFVQDCLKQLRARHGDDTQLVVVYDSIEHLRGTTANAQQVADSVERLFRGHADALRFPYVHTVFTVPPWLRVQYAGVGTDRFDNYCQIPCVKVRVRPERPGVKSVDHTAGLDALWRIASKRGDLIWLLGDREAFDEIARFSGGYLRDLFRMLSLVVNDASSHDVPVSPERRRLAVDELRGAYVGFTNHEAAWLRTIDETGVLDIDEATHHHNLARFLDTHVLLAYRNGEDWYGVHPVIRDVVTRRARAWDQAHGPRARETI